MSEWMSRTGQGFRELVWPSVGMDARARIEVFAGDVLRFGRVQNLVSRQDPVGEVARLVEESVRGDALLRSGKGDCRLLEIGSGAGFPGLVLASLHPEWEFVLVERRRARCDFLERCVSRLGLKCVRVIAEDVRSIQEGHFDVVTGKAVAEAGVFVGLACPHLDDGGAVLLFQRERWSPPEGWVVVESAVSLEQPARSSRVAYLIRRSEG